jgi:hypothetical protein
MSRGNTPFGYRIENGVAVVLEDQAEKIRKMYAGYLSGLSLRNAAKEAGVIAMHASVKGLLQNPRLLGDGFYPAIINRDTFDAFEAERKRREEAQGRDKRKKKTVEPVPAPTSFRMAQALETFSDPYLQAEYLYSLIESEV